MEVQKALIQINREYEGISFLYNDFADESPLSLLSNLRISNYQSPFLKISNRSGYGTSVQFMADNSTPEAVFIAMFAFEGKIDHLLLLDSLRQFDKQIQFDTTIPPAEMTFRRLTKLKGAEELFFAILTHKQIVIISEQEILVRKFILELLAILPPVIFRNRTFLTHADTYRSDIDVLGLADTKKNLKELKNDSTVVMLDEGIIFGSGQTDFTTRICDRIQARDLIGFDLLMDQILDIALNLTGSKEDEDTISRKYSLSRADAALVLSLYESITGEY